MSKPPADDTSIAERLHDGHIKGRPISWVVVSLVIGGFIAAGIGLIIALPWLFIVGVCAVAVATILGAATHAMADVTARVETKARRRIAVQASSSHDDASSEAVGAEPATSGNSRREPAHS